MLIGIPKEIKNNEYRVGATPESVAEFVKHGHEVIVEHNLGIGIGASNEDYIQAGAKIIQSAQEIFDRAEMIIKVKEPQLNECAMLRENQILFTYLHLAPDPKQTDALVASKSIAIAYETVTSDSGTLPLLTPMSEVAGRLASQMGAHYLCKQNGGSGVLMGGVPGTLPAKVMVIGAGVVGSNAAAIAMGMGADVTILDTNIARLKEMDDLYQGRLKTLYSNAANIQNNIQEADVVISSVLIPGALAAKLITKPMLKTMKKGSVIVDVAIDQGGTMETSKATTHEDPVFEIDGVVHYCVANMPGSVARTSSYALNNAVLPYAIQIANKGAEQAMKDNKHLLNGLNVYKGAITYKAVCDAQNKPYEPKTF